MSKILFLLVFSTLLRNLHFTEHNIVETAKDPLWQSWLTLNTLIAFTMSSTRMCFFPWQKWHPLYWVLPSKNLCTQQTWQICDLLSCCCFLGLLITHLFDNLAGNKMDCQPVYRFLALHPTIQTPISNLLKGKECSIYRRACSSAVWVA